MDVRKQNSSKNHKFEKKNKSLNAREERRKNKDHDAWFNGQFEARPIYVAPGHFECTDDPKAMLVANVGSGVVICVQETGLNVGGMCYLLIPESLQENFPNMEDGKAEEALRHVDGIMESFINALKRLGAGKARIRIRIIGGTSLMENIVDGGLKNYIFAKEYLQSKGLQISSIDIGGESCRRVHFFPATGRMVQNKLKRMSDATSVRNIEKSYQNGLATQTMPPADGGE